MAGIADAVGLVARNTGGFVGQLGLWMDTVQFGSFDQGVDTRINPDPE